MKVEWENVRSVLAAAASAGVFSALIIILGRLWTQSYYSVFGLPTSDLEFSVMDYAFQTKEILLMLVLAAFIGGVLWLVEGAHIVLESSDPVILPSKKDPQHARSCRERVRGLVRRALRGLGWLPLFGGLNLLGRAILIGAVIGLGLLAFLASSKPSSADWVWKYSGVLGLWGGVSVGLAMGTLGVMARQLWKQSEFLWCALPAGLIVALVAVFVPWSTGELAEFKAIRDLRTGELPQAIIEFREEAPAAIRRSDDPAKTQLAHLVLATSDRLAIAYPFGCKSVGEPKEPLDETAKGKPRREICDIFTFDRKDVRSMRIFGKGTDRPFNDERTNPIVVDLPADGTTPYEQDLDLTAAQKDRCGDQSDDIGEARGVWLQLNALQSGRVSFQERPAKLYLSPEGHPNECTKLLEGEGVRLHVDDKLMVLAAAQPDDRIVTPLKFTFVPLEFRPVDVYVGQKKDTAVTMTVPFSVQDRSSVSVIVDVDGIVSAAPECVEAEAGLPENGQPGITRVQVEIAPSDSTAAVSLCPDADPQGETGPTSVAFTMDQPLEPGRWDLSLSKSAGIRSFRIILSPLPAEDISQEERSDE